MLCKNDTVSRRKAYPSCLPLIAALYLLTVTGCLVGPVVRPNHGSADSGRPAGPHPLVDHIQRLQSDLTGGPGRHVQPGSEAG